METKTTTINGKQVTLCYCYATEINYSTSTNGENASVFVQDTAKKLDALSKGDVTAQPDIKKCIYLVLAAAIAYSSSKGEEPPITADDFLFNDKPSELYEALAQVIVLYSGFYKLMPSEQEKQKGSKSKN